MGGGTADDQRRPARYSPPGDPTALTLRAVFRLAYARPKA